MPIQVILVVAIALVGWTLFRGPGSSSQRAIRKLIASGLVFGGAVVVAVPDLLTRVANVLGVGRGTDLLLYGLAVTFGFAAVAFYQRIFHLERRVEALTRALALSSADGISAQDSHL